MRRVAWCVFVLVCISICIWQTYFAIDQYFDYETVHSISIQRHKSLSFPAITICNINQIRQSFADSFGPEVSYALSRFTLASYAWTDSSSSALDLSMLPALGAVINMTFHEFLKAAPTTDSDTFLHCYEDQDFNCLDYVISVRTSKGMCYTFNSKNSSNQFTLQSKYPGIDGGIALVLNAQVEEYFAPILSDGVGFMIHIHDPDDFPLLDHGGILIAPGKDIFLSIEKEIVHSLKKPYTEIDCNDDATYSYSKCRRDCMIKHIFECHTCSFASDADHPCSFAEGSLCYLQNMPDWVNGKRGCNCPVQCTNTMYNHKISSAKYPNDLVVRNAAVLGWPYQTSDNIEQNVVRLKIFFDSITTTEVNERAVVNQWQLFSTIGGLMGLFMGGSIITMCEFPDFIVVYLGKRWKEKTKRQTVMAEIK